MASTETLFDLSAFDHYSLFKDTRFVWEGILKLKGYMSQLRLGNIACDIPEGVTLVNPEAISIGAGTVIERGSYIEGPCMIGENCVLRHGSYIRPFVLTGNHCVIGHGREIKHSIFLNRAQAPHFNYVGDSILGNGVNIGAGVICANYRLDGKEIPVVVNDKRFSTGVNKLGSFIGDYSQIGCNCVVNPGVILRKKTLSKACQSLQESNLRDV